MGKYAAVVANRITFNWYITSSAANTQWTTTTCSFEEDSDDLAFYIEHVDALHHNEGKKFLFHYVLSARYRGHLQCNVL